MTFSAVDSISGLYDTQCCGQYIRALLHSVLGRVYHGYMTLSVGDSISGLYDTQCWGQYIRVYDTQCRGQCIKHL